METKDLHDQIMNIRTNDNDIKIFLDRTQYRYLGRCQTYKLGHRDARHAAAELAITNGQLIEDLNQQITKLKNQIKLLLADAEKNCKNCVTNDSQNCRDCFRNDDPDKDILVDGWISPEKEIINEEQYDYLRCCSNCDFRQSGIRFCKLHQSAKYLRDGMSICAKWKVVTSSKPKKDPVFYEINLIVDQNIVVHHCLDTLWKDLIVTSSDPRVEVREMKGARDRIGAVIGTNSEKIDTTIRIEVKAMKEKEWRNKVKQIFMDKYAHTEEEAQAQADAFEIEDIFENTPEEAVEEEISCWDLDPSLLEE